MLLNDKLGEAVNESFRTICAYYQVPLIELRDIDKQKDHPSVKGMRQICDQINAFIAGER